MAAQRATEQATLCAERCRGERDVAGCMVDCLVDKGLLGEAGRWINVLRETLGSVMGLYGFRHVLFSREFRSFLDDPWRHLRKKLFIYTHDYLRGRIDAVEYGRKALSALNTSLRTNLRTLYQNWCYLAVLIHLYRPGAKPYYPEHGILSLERSGKQRLRWIPPNLVLWIPGHGYLSFFLEAPRPIAWEDTSDLRKTWKLYTALRPDTMVYGGRVLDMLEPGRAPPIKRPDVIIEYKELIDWYRRSREVRGPFARPLTAEEWRNKWIRGLWEGLADVLGVKRAEELATAAEKRRGVRLSEVKVVELYRAVYNPGRMYLVSRYSVPGEVREELEAHDIVVVDNVGFDPAPLRVVAEALLGYARGDAVYRLEVTNPELARLLAEIRMRSNGDFEEVLLSLLRRAVAANEA